MQLYEAGIKESYFPYPIFIEQKVDFLQDAENGKFSPHYVYAPQWEKPFLFRLETHVVDHCNLNCSSCNNFSSLEPCKSFASVEQYDKDLARLKTLFDNVCILGLQGGEPLLDPDRALHFAEVARKHFPHSDIRILTNGLLIPKCSDDFYMALKSLDDKFGTRIYDPEGGIDIYAEINPWKILRGLCSPCYLCSYCARHRSQEDPWKSGPNQDVSDWLIPHRFEHEKAVDTATIQTQKEQLAEKQRQIEEKQKYAENQEKQIMDLRSTLEKDGLQINSLNEAIQSRQVQLDQVKETLKEDALQIEALEEEVANHKALLATVRTNCQNLRQEKKQLRQAYRQAKNTIESMTNSRSWRITKPLRAITGVTRKKNG